MNPVQRFLNTFQQNLNRNIQAKGDVGQVQLARAVSAAQLHKDLVKLPSAAKNPGVIKQQLLDAKQNAKLRIKVSKDMLKNPPKGLDLATNKEVSEQMIRDAEKQLEDLNKALKDIDIYKAMKEKTGVASHASGGRVSLSSGGVAGMLGE